MKAKEVAKATRRWAELVVRTEWARGGYGQSDLGGFCALATIELYRQLKGAGHCPRICLARDDDFNYHCFVLLDGKVVDVTASQFGHQAVVVRKPAVRLWYWRPFKVYKTLAGFKSRLRADDWDCEVPLEVRQRAWEEAGNGQRA